MIKNVANSEYNPKAACIWHNVPSLSNRPHASLSHSFKKLSKGGGSINLYILIIFEDVKMLSEIAKYKINSKTNVRKFFLNVNKKITKKQASVEKDDRTEMPTIKPLKYLICKSLHSLQVSKWAVKSIPNSKLNKLFLIFYLIFINNYYIHSCYLIVNLFYLITAKLNK